MEGRHDKAVEVFSEMLAINGKCNLRAYSIVRELAAALRHAGRQEEALAVLVGANLCFERTF